MSNQAHDDPHDAADADAYAELLHMLTMLTDGDRMRLYPRLDNPPHTKPIMATYSGGYFYCDGSDPADGPDYYLDDVATYNKRIEYVREDRKQEEYSRTQVHAKIQVALIDAGLSDDDALTAMRAIARGLVPHVRIEY